MNLRGVLRVSLVAGVVAALGVVIVPEADASGLPGNCALSADKASVTCSFSYIDPSSGNPVQLFVVPSWVSSLQVTAIGARGGDGEVDNGSTLGGSGGAGALVSGSVPVTGGSALRVFVGGTPTGGTDCYSTTPCNGGYNGGGSVGNGSGSPLGFGGGGGGASELDYNSTLLIVAAGGGGGSENDPSCYSSGFTQSVDVYGDGGAADATAPTVSCSSVASASGGGGGTPSAGGSAGAGTPTNAVPGASGTLGQGASAVELAGAGGGGIHGGGSGAVAQYLNLVTVESGGGGGGSLVPTGGSESTTAQAAGITITYPLQPQSISFTGPGSGSVGAPGSLSATGGASGEPVTFASTTPNICTVTGSSVAYQAVGTCTVTADQAGDGVSYAPAPEVSQSFPVVQGSVTTIVDSTYSIYGAPGLVSAHVVPAVSGTVAFTIDGNAAGSTPVTVGNGYANATLSTSAGLSAGTHSVAATFTPTDTTDYQAATSIPGTLTIAPAGTSTILAAPSGVVFGQAASVMASVSATGAPVPPGSIDFTIDGHDAGSVAVDGSGSATLSGISGLGVGSHDVVATFTPGNGNYVGSTSTHQTLVVSQAATSTSVPKVGLSSISVMVSPNAPGAGTPTGTVTFYAGGTQIGTAPVQPDGSATLTYASRGAVVIAAQYGGNTDFLGSSNSTAVSNPTITAHVSSRVAKTRFGWYHTPVRVSFACTAGSGALSQPCPAPVMLSGSGAAQHLTETILDTDGGIATASVSGINIDRTQPRITIHGVKERGSYNGAVPKITCTATAGPSGLTPAGCRVRRTRSGSTLRYVATATSKAGLTRTVRGHITVNTVFIRGLALRHGAYTLRKGHLYDLRAYARGAVAPVLLYAAPLGARPGGGHAIMTPIGNGLWQITIALNRTPYTHWVLDVRIGKTSYQINITLI